MTTTVHKRLHRVVLAAGCAAILAGPLAGTGVAAAAETTLVYACPFLSGEQQVTARIAAAFPGTAGAGEAIEAGAVTVTVTLPPAALADLTAAGAASVAATARLSVAVNQNGTTAGADWSGLAAPGTPLPSEGDLVLAAAGQAPAVTVGAAGRVTFTAGDLGLELTMSTVDELATGPAKLDLACTLRPGQDARLASVRVPGADPTTTDPGATPAPGGGIRVEPGPATPQAPQPGAIAENPPGCWEMVIPPGGRPGCAWVPGYSTVRKLNGSVRIPETLTNVAIMNPRLVPGPPPMLIVDNPAELVGGRVPPVTGTFLAFGFAPITATLELTQVGPMNIHGESTTRVPITFTVKVTAKLAARIHDVAVNGVPLDVGPDCRTAEPIDIELNGGSPEYVDILKGGPLRGAISIPPFTGCGVTEDLDPLLTGTVSGPGNRVKLVQGQVCTPPQRQCPPPIPPLPPPDVF